MSDLDKSIKTNFRNEKHRMLANIVFTSNWLKNNMNDFIAPFGLSNQQFNILRILRGNGDWMAMSEIKSVMIDKSPHTTRMVNKLLDKGWVQREQGTKDRRVVFVKITQKGLDLLAEIDKQELDIVGFLERISDEEAASINKLLDRMRE